MSLKIQCQWPGGIDINSNTHLDDMEEVDLLDEGSKIFLKNYSYAWLMIHNPNEPFKAFLDNGRLVITEETRDV